MTASPNDGTAAADGTRAAPPAGSTPLPRRTQRTTAIAEAAASTSATPADWTDGRTVTERSRRAAEIPEEPEDPSGAPGSTFADGFAAGLAFAPRPATEETGGGGAAQAAAGAAAPSAPRPRSRRTVLIGAVLAVGVLACVPFAVRAVDGDGRGAATVTITDAASGDRIPGDVTAPASPSAALSPSAPNSPRRSPGTSASAGDSAGSTPSPDRTGGNEKPGGAGKPGGTAQQPTAGTSSTGAPADETVPDGAILNPASGRCIDNSTPNNTPLQVWDCTGSPQQTWQVMPDTSIRSVGRCLDVVNGSRDDGAGIQLADCNGTGAQQFRFDSAHRLVNLQAGKCVTLEDASGANGTRLHLWTCGSAAGQKWTAH
ncbi:ricin-type beta-trefoil lectin domain protein [Streptomyces sp. MI02-7b]|uniref:ricin-type beta-trefoil lectin domain protein n=1 Tax=Streptomyces sp. MI02-7b TaxID=462941 RepID=UPI0029A666AB|nr:RICIN domain-containing protein [Streptomyces sp. MI02-7b]MDX3075635.1 ricin-type beta-trefoil lectin domain protein [Streptomyces sp. MI02-7b]